jgi:hypothetical protein
MRTRTGRRAPPGGGTRLAARAAPARADPQIPKRRVCGRRVSPGRPCKPRGRNRAYPPGRPPATSQIRRASAGARRYECPENQSSSRGSRSVARSAATLGGSSAPPRHRSWPGYPSKRAKQANHKSQIPALFIDTSDPARRGRSISGTAAVDSQRDNVADRLPDREKKINRKKVDDLEAGGVNLHSWAADSRRDLSTHHRQAPTAGAIRSRHPANGTSLGNSPYRSPSESLRSNAESPTVVPAE